MKLRYASIALAGSVILAACSDQASMPVAPNVAAKGAVVAAKPGTSIVLFSSQNSVPASFAARVAALGGTVDQIYQGAGIAVVSGLTDDAAANLTRLGGVREVQPDAEFTLDTPVASVDADASDVATTDPSVASVANPAGAPRYPWQWNMRAINAPAAWAAGKLGNAGVTVAILDTGIDYDNPDLNGLVDLSRSASFIASDNAITAKYFPTRNLISDYHGHGTNVAAQVSSKAAVHAGVTSKTTLIGVKVLAASGSGSLSAVLSGVIWAADHGADVANMSLGGGFAKAGNGRYVGLINRTFTYAAQKGMLVVVAAGNDEADLDHNGNELTTYCGVPQVLCVSSVGPKTAADFSTAGASTPSEFTNFGRSAIDVAGPGGNYHQLSATSYEVSAWPWGADIASWVWSYCSKTRLAGLTSAGVPVLAGCQAGNRVTGYVGTSQATPHVAGLAALLVAERGHGQPALIKQRIRQSADDLGQPGVDPYYGAGRINVAKALGL